VRISLLTLFVLLLWAVPSRADQELAVYPGTVHTRIGNDLLINGQYHRMAYFTTRDPMMKVAKYFTDHWSKQGYPVVADGDFEQEGVVSAFYTREGLQRAVVLRRHMGKTVGFTVLKDLWLYEKPSAGQDKAIRVEGPLFSSEVSTRDEAGGSRHSTQLVERGMDEVRQELVSKFTAAGYKAVRESGGKLDGQRTLVLEHTRGAEQVMTTLVQLADSRVAVSQTWVGTDRPDGMPNADAVRQAREAAMREGLVKEKKP
jgi:hypothetical protein